MENQSVAWQKNQAILALGERPDPKDLLGMGVIVVAMRLQNLRLYRRQEA